MIPAEQRRIAIYGPPSAWRSAFQSARREGGRVVSLFAEALEEERPELQRALKQLREGRYDILILQIEP